MFMIGGRVLVLHQQLHHYFIVTVHCRRLCRSLNTLRAWSTQVVAAAAGWAVEIGKRPRDGLRLLDGSTRFLLVNSGKRRGGNRRWQMANLAGVVGEMGWTGDLCLPRGAWAI
jgi:hypothetical protein